MGWPCKGTEWYGVVMAVNDSIDLENSFPKCRYFSFEEFCRRLSAMKCSGLEVV